MTINCGRWTTESVRVCACVCVQMEKRCIIRILLSLVIVVLSLGLGLGLGLDTSLQTSFINTCETFPGYDCPALWQEFEKAYVGKDPCSVPPDAYSNLMAAAPFKPNCNNLMLWSKTKDIVADMTTTRKCFTRLESTVLGASLSNKDWCGKDGSKETFTKGCPECFNNPVSSFWAKVSELFAESACGDVTVMLDGARKDPFDPNSFFGSTELPRLRPPGVISLMVVLVMDKNSQSTCINPSLELLNNKLNAGIRYGCREVQRTRIRQCASDTSIDCKNCW